MILRQTCGNHILSSIPESVFETWQAHFEHVHLTQGMVLHEPGKSVAHVYFPVSAIVSWIYVLENGASTEIAMTGREGVVGLYLLLGNEPTPNQAVVQTPGLAIRIRLSVVLNSFNEGHAVQRLILRFTYALINQMGQGNVCRQHHSVEQQLCRMLLMIIDRQDSLQVNKTHEAFSNLLGVRREAVSLAAAKLMQEGLISYSRGHMEVLNRHRLEQRACECYEVLSQQYLPMLQTNHACQASCQTDTI